MCLLYLIFKNYKCRHYDAQMDSVEGPFAQSSELLSIFWILIIYRKSIRFAFTVSHCLVCLRLCMVSIPHDTYWWIIWNAFLVSLSLLLIHSEWSYCILTYYAETTLNVHWRIDVAVYNIHCICTVRTVQCTGYIKYAYIWCSLLMWKYILITLLVFTRVRYIAE